MDFPCSKCGCTDHSNVTYCKSCGMYFGASLHPVIRGQGLLSMQAVHGAEFLLPGILAFVAILLLLTIAIII